MTFEAAFPFAKIDFQDEKFPGAVQLEAFNPFIPSNDRDSSLPASFFTWTVHNTTGKPVTYTIAFACGNPLEEETCNKEFHENGLTGIGMTGKYTDTPERLNGSVMVSTDAECAAVQEYWYRGQWFDELTVYWNDLSLPGAIPPRHYDLPGRYDSGVVTASVTLQPYETKDVRFLLSWYVPVFVKTWHSGEEAEKPRWNNYYVKLFASHAALRDYAFEQWERLERESRLFSQALHGSSLPPTVTEAVAANLAILKSPTCLRLENGAFYAFEGLNKECGSCEGSCDHVWNYAYALPFLFPSLERSMRELVTPIIRWKTGACSSGLCCRWGLPIGASALV